MSGFRAADPPLLLIEDNVRDAALIQTYLRRDGGAVRWVDRLSRGLEIIRHQSVSEVLLDLNLPDSHGLDTVHRFREAAPTVPVVVITGADDQQLVGRVLEAGASDYLIKGRFDSNELRSIVARLRARPRTEAEMLAAEERYRSVLGIIQAGLVAIDANGVITYVNDQMAEFLQRPPHELLGRNPFEFMDESSARTARKYLERRRNGHSDRYNLPFRRADGSNVLLSVAATPLYDLQGRYAGAAATFLDLHQQSAAGGAQHDAEERFQAMVENVPIGVFTAFDAVFSYVNPEFARMLGYSPDDLTSRDCLELIVPEDRELFPIDGQMVRFVRADGAVVALQLQISTATVLGRTTVVGTARDLTDVSRDIERKNLLAGIVENTEDAVMSCDLRGVVLTWNKGAERILGYTAAEVVGKRNIRSLVPDDLRGESDRILETVLGSKHVEHFQTRRLAKSGEEKSVSLAVAPVQEPGGRIIGISAIMRDITAQKIADKQLEQQTRLSSLGRMATSIAHEFNNVLMGIQPFAEILEKSASNEERVRKAAGQIRTSVRRGKAVAEEILRYSNPKPPSVKNLPLAPWLQTTMVPELQGVLTPAIELRVKAPADLVIVADPSQLAQILVNLALNSKHSMPAGGTLTIRASRCQPGDRFRFGQPAVVERFVHIEVEDTGAGMSASVLERVFEPLFTTKSGGSGLGLPLVHQIVQRHGGHVFVESTPNVGTTFHLFLLADEQTTADEVEAISASPTQARRRVLIVEDEVEIALGLKELFGLEGIESDIVYDAGAVAGAIERFDPDVVLLDVMLGEDSGFDVYRSVAERWPNLPVIFSTGTATEKEVESLAGAPNVTLLRKPYDFTRLMAEIGSATARPRA